VKAFAAVAVIVILLLGILLVSGGDHGPGRHTGSGATDRQTAPNVSESGGDGHQLPAGGHTP
jgi:hypothetical protein